MVVTTTTGLITLALLALAPSLWRTQRTAVLTAAGIGLFALLIRLFASWGPGDLAEARRWDILYALQPESRPGMALVPNLANLLSHLGIPSLWLYRGVGLTTGAMIAVLTFTAATVSQLRKPWPVFAGLLVAAWPAHVHYSATGGYTTLGPLLFLLAWTLLRAETMAPIARLFLSSALLTASVYARPEYPLLALAVLPLLLQPGWNLRMRLTFLGTFAVFVVSYLAVMGSTHGVALESTWADHARWLIWDLRVSPTFWLVLAFLGLGLSTLDLWTRVSLGLGLIGLLVGYSMASEPNPLFGQWRYYVSMLPLFSLLAAGFLARFVPTQRQGYVAIAVLLLSLAVYTPLWWQPADLQADFQSLRQSAATTQPGDLLLLSDRRAELHVGLDAMATSLLALHLSSGRVQMADRQHPDLPTDFGDQKVQSLEAWLDQGAPLPKGRRTLAWLGLTVQASTRQQLAERVQLRRLFSENLRVSNTLPMAQTPCSRSQGQGLTLQPCLTTVGWYALEPR